MVEIGLLLLDHPELATVQVQSFFCCVSSRTSLRSNGVNYRCLVSKKDKTKTTWGTKKCKQQSDNSEKKSKFAHTFPSSLMKWGMKIQCD